MPETIKGDFELVDLHPRLASLQEEVLEGLRSRPRRLPPKLFYDKRGSELFEQITRLPEYYLTRTEIAILRRNVPSLASRIGSDVAIIELGSGSSTKVRILLEALDEPITYIPIDISREHLAESAGRINDDYPSVRVVAVCADYLDGLAIPETGSHRRRLLFFPGSTIGNFEPDEARRFLDDCSRALRRADLMIIGVDLVKKTSILDRAYDDSAGVTAEFNRNMLARLNRELAADFDLDAFAHVAWYNEAAGRIEMYLESIRDQTIHCAGESFELAAGERIHTENSYKYSVDAFHELLKETRFRPSEVWIDEGKLFSVHVLEVSG
ncbi:MAG TPA: L-histidine N(alpha)-methyltransferase [Thermoanaerobaculia bacterium]|nr:L-histidine N(alpha)-methyltransferase [Thermoanaerobaculia bacterium]